MTLSRDILHLLDIVDWPPEVPVQYLTDFYENHAFPSGFSSAEERAESHEIRQLLSPSISRAAEARLEPNLEPDDLLERLPASTRDERLDEYFTVKMLAQVSGFVRRLRHLRPVLVARHPSEKVTNYLRQASTCYLYGLPDAASVLCRAVLEFALKEALGAKLRVLGEDYRGSADLEDLIRFARGGKVLPEALADAADRVRNRGNASIHRVSADENEALVQIRETGEVLSHLYGRAGR